MSSDNSVYDDLMEALHEVEEHQKGNIKLKSTIIALPDDDISAKFNKLPKEAQQAVRVIIDKMLMANSQ